MIAHIRLATRGNLEYGNCHPFVMRDNYDRTWTLAHNGTIFDCPELDKYVHTQECLTDSERILCHIIGLVNERQTQAGRALMTEERSILVDQAICRIAPRNKLNLLIYDSEQFYVHTNYANSLFVKQTDNTAVFSTTPLGGSDWKPVPFTTMLVYQAGRQVLTGTYHGCEYRDDPKDTHLLFVDYSTL